MMRRWPFRVKEWTNARSPAGRALSAWIEVLASDDDERAREHYDSRFADSFREHVPGGRDSPGLDRAAVAHPTRGRGEAAALRIVETLRE